VRYLSPVVGWSYWLLQVTLAHEMLLFGIFDQSTLPDHLFDGVMTLGDESIQLGQELLTLLNGQHDDVSGLADGGAASDVADAESMRFDPRYPETSTVMELRKHTLALIVDLFGLRASKKIQVRRLGCRLSTPSPFKTNQALPRRVAAAA
jgi:hypothetical protein